MPDSISKIWNSIAKRNKLPTSDDFFRIKRKMTENIEFHLNVYKAKNKNRQYWMITWDTNGKYNTRTVTTCCGDLADNVIWICKLYPKYTPLLTISLTEEQYLEASINKSINDQLELEGFKHCSYFIANNQSDI